MHSLGQATHLMVQNGLERVWLQRHRRSPQPEDMMEYSLDDFRQCQDWNDRETRTFRSDEVDMTAI